MRSLRPVLAFAVLAALLAVSSAGAANSVTYSDSTGEPGVRDITTIVVSNDDKGMITFRINIPSLPQYTTDVDVDVYVDSDNNAATGSPDLPGVDYVIQLFRGEVNLYKWDGTDFTRRFGDPPATTLIYQWSNGVSIKISATELGNTKRLRFFAGVISGIVFNETTGEPDFTNSVADFAPDLGRGFFAYEVKIAPARVVFKSLKTAPAAPKAGKTFTVRMAATRSDTGAAIINGRVDCTAKAGARSVQPNSERFVGGQAVCVFTVPANASGKTLRGTIKIVFEGKTLARPFSAKIR
ncbi:MAG TPA: hypothetical protein VIH21_12165 [Dehalococcoidia bacterium]|jgi:hypothetical protein